MSTLKAQAKVLFVQANMFLLGRASGGGLLAQLGYVGLQRRLCRMEGRQTGLFLLKRRRPGFMLGRKVANTGGQCLSLCQQLAEALRVRSRR